MHNNHTYISDDRITTKHYPKVYRVKSKSTIQVIMDYSVPYDMTVKG